MSQCWTEALKENCVLCKECDNNGKCLKCKKNSLLINGQCSCFSNYKHNLYDDVCVLKNTMDVKTSNKTVENESIISKSEFSNQTIDHFNMTSIANSFVAQKHGSQVKSNFTKNDLQSKTFRPMPIPDILKSSKDTSMSQSDVTKFTEETKEIQNKDAKQKSESKFVNGTLVSKSDETIKQDDDKKVNLLNETKKFNETKVIPLNNNMIVLANSNSVPNPSESSGPFKINSSITTANILRTPKTGLPDTVKYEQSSGTKSTSKYDDMNKPKDSINKEGVHSKISGPQLENTTADKSKIPIDNNVKINNYIQKTDTSPSVPQSNTLIKDEKSLIPPVVRNSKNISNKDGGGIKIENDIHGVIDEKYPVLHESHDNKGTVKKSRSVKNLIRNINIIIGNNNVRVLNKQDDN